MKRLISFLQLLISNRKMTHDQFIYGVNAAFAELTALTSMKSLCGIPVPLILSERERLACILIDVVNEHQEFGESLLDPIDYYNASKLLNLCLGTAYEYDFLTIKPLT